MNDTAEFDDNLVPEKVKKKDRLMSLDAFRGFTILGMVFVIAVAAGGYWKEVQNPLPQRMGWFGSLPLSTWFHADMGYEIWRYELEGRGLTEEEIEALPEYEENTARAKIGLTFTDLIAPWFVFIVGVCIPLSRSRRGADWWRHVSWRTIMLIIAGIVYISLVIKQVTWWWGVLQAIGVAYFAGALLCKVRPGAVRWLIVFAVGILNLILTQYTAWWTEAFESIDKPFGTLTNPNGNWLRPLIVHCQPWLSISYGVMTMIGVLVGEAIVTRNHGKITRQCIVVGAVFMVIGYALHKTGLVTGNYKLAFNKPDVTTSYAFFSAGFGAIVFLAFYYIIDVFKVKAWAKPLNVFGTNPLLAYFMMIVLRRVLESLGLIGAFNRTAGNEFADNWATYFGAGGEPAQWVYAFFAKGGYMGVFWGLVYCFLLWLIVLCFNRKNLYWKF